jgi:hypothetical protein
MLFPVRCAKPSSQFLFFLNKFSNSNLKLFGYLMPVKVWFWMKLLFLYFLTSTYCLILWCPQCHVLALIVVWCFITTIRSYLHFEAPNKSTVALAFAEFYINYTARYAWALVPWLLITKLRPWLPLHLTQTPLLGQVTILWLSHLVTL